MILLVAAYSFAIGACASAVAIVMTGDWRHIRRAKKQRELESRARLGRLAIAHEHSRALLASSNAINFDGGWR